MAHEKEHTFPYATSPVMPLQVLSSPEGTTGSTVQRIGSHSSDVATSFSSKHVSPPTPALHTRSFVTSHSDLAPSTPHVEATVHAVHGSWPDAENAVPATQGVLHTASVVLVQSVLTPFTPHARHAAHGALPDAENVVPATQAELHSVLDVLVHADATPAEHVDAAAHAAHGALPDAENVVPATQET